MFKGKEVFKEPAFSILTSGFWFWEDGRSLHLKYGKPYLMYYYIRRKYDLIKAFHGVTIGFINCHNISNSMFNL